MKAPVHQSERMVNVVGRLMKKKKVFDKYAAIKGLGREKAWEERGVRRVMSYLLEKRIFDNALDSRKGTQLFLLKNSQIMENSRIPALERKNLVREQTRFYIDDLIRRNKVGDKAQFAERFVLTMKLTQERLTHCMGEIHQIGKIEKSNKAGLANFSVEEVELAKIAARDGFAHLSMHLSYLIGEMPEVIRAAEKVRDEYKSIMK